MATKFVWIEFTIEVDDKPVVVCFGLDGKKVNVISMISTGRCQLIPLGKGRDAYKPCITHVERIVKEHLN